MSGFFQGLLPPVLILSGIITGFRAEGVESVPIIGVLVLAAIVQVAIGIHIGHFGFRDTAAECLGREQKF